MLLYAVIASVLCCTLCCHMLSFPGFRQVGSIWLLYTVKSEKYLVTLYFTRRKLTRGSGWQPVNVLDYNLVIYGVCYAVPYVVVCCHCYCSMLYSMLSFPGFRQVRSIWLLYTFKSEAYLVTLYFTRRRLTRGSGWQPVIMFWTKASKITTYAMLYVMLLYAVIASVLCCTLCCHMLSFPGFRQVRSIWLLYTFYSTSTRQVTWCY